MAFHLLQQLVNDALDGDDFLFVGAHDVVIKGGAIDDTAAGKFKIGRFIDHHRRVAGAGTNSAFAARHCLAHYAAATGYCQDAHALVCHECLRGFDGRLGNGADQVGRTATTNDRAMQKSNIGHRALAGAGVHVEDDAVARREHGDSIADDRGGRIGCRCDGADHTIGRVLGERQAIVAGDGLRLEHLRPAGLTCDQAVLDQLVLDAAEPGLALRVACKLLGMFEHRLPNRGNDLMSPVERHAVELAKCDTCRGYCVVDCSEDAFAELCARSAGRLVVGSSNLCRTRRRCREAFGEAGCDDVHLLIAKEISVPPWLAHASASPLRYFSSPSISQLSTIAMTTASTGF